MNSTALIGIICILLGILTFALYFMAIDGMYEIPVTKRRFAKLLADIESTNEYSPGYVVAKIHYLGNGKTVTCFGLYSGCYVRFSTKQKAILNSAGQHLLQQQFAKDSLPTLQEHLKNIELSKNTRLTLLNNTYHYIEALCFEADHSESYKASLIAKAWAEHNLPYFMRKTSPFEYFLSYTLMNTTSSNEILVDNTEFQLLVQIRNSIERLKGLAPTRFDFSRWPSVPRWNDIVAKYIPIPIVSDFDAVPAKDLPQGKLLSLAAKAYNTRDFTLAKIVLAYAQQDDARVLIGDHLYSRIALFVDEHERTHAHQNW